MARRDDIVAYLDRELEVSRFRDYLPLGLQVEGADEVTHVATAVSASLEVFERAGEVGADMLIVHHGLFGSREDRRIRAFERRRLEALFRADITLLAYHLPLDAHPLLGNNACLARLLGIADHVAFAEHDGNAIGRAGRLPVPVSPTGLAALLGGLLGSTPQVFPGGPGTLANVGIISGAGAREVGTARAAGLDALITGEPSEDLPYLATEHGVTVVTAGHNATETVGVQALGQRLTEVFGLRHTFLAVVNPV